MERRKFDEEEARRLLEDLARTGPPSAQVAAIRVLLKLDREERELEEARSPTGFDSFDELYELEERPT